VVDLEQQVQLARLQDVGARLGCVIEVLHGHVVAGLEANGLVDKRGGAGADNLLVAPDKGLEALLRRLVVHFFFVGRLSGTVY